jgi:hypothetical protein
VTKFLPGEQTDILASVIFTVRDSPEDTECIEMLEPAHFRRPAFSRVENHWISPDVRKPRRWLNWTGLDWIGLELNAKG